MPFLPTDTECNGLFPSICGNKMHPTMNYNFLCTGCMPRPYGDCLSDLLIPDICLNECDVDCSIVGSAVVGINVVCG